jgi:pilus assembly protein CpaB
MTAKRNRRILLLALLLASVSALLAYGLIASRPQVAPVVVEAAPVSGEPVLVGARTITSGTTLGAGDIEVAYVAPEAKGDRVLTDSAQAIGQVALVDISKGEQILVNSVGASAAPTADTFARDVPVGMRAVSIALEEIVGVGGFVQPGDRVDVITSYDLLSPESESPAENALDALGELVDMDMGGGSDAPFAVAELIVQDVEVLAIGQSLDGSQAAAPPPAPAAATTSGQVQEPKGPTPNPAAVSATLLVNPTQALRLLLAVQSDGKFRLLLRAPGDVTTTELPPALVTSGGIQMDPFKLIGANLVEKNLVITDARVRQTSVPAGGILEFEVTVRNVSSQLIPAGRGGAAPGHVYEAGESWQSLDETSPDGVYSVGLTSDSAEPRTYPWRWDLGEDLAPGQTATVTGGIQVPHTPGVQRWWFGTLLQPGTVLEDGVAPAEITVEPVLSVEVTAPEIDLRDSPWPSATSVLKMASGARADVLEYQDGWFLVRVDQTDGWVPESAVTNVALLSALATPEAVRSEMEASQ